MAIGTALGLAQLGMGVYGGIKGMQEKERAADELARVNREQRSKDTYFSNKVTSRYNKDRQRELLLKGGDFSKAGPEYNIMKSQIARGGDIAEDTLVDNAQKRGLAETGIVAAGQNQIADSASRGLAQGMGTIVANASSNPGLLDMGYNMNQGLQNEVGQATQEYQGIQPSLGNATQGVTNLAKLYDGYQAKRANEEFIERILAKYSTATTGA